MKDKFSLKNPLVVLCVLIISIIMFIGIYYGIKYSVSKGFLPSYKCETGFIVQQICKGGDCVSMCNSGDIYKKRIEYYK